MDSESIIGVSCCDCGNIVSFNSRYDETAYVFICELCGNAFFTDLNYEVIDEERRRDYRCIDVVADVHAAAETLGFPAHAVESLGAAIGNESVIAFGISDGNERFVITYDDDTYFYKARSYCEVSLYFAAGGTYIWENSIVIDDYLMGYRFLIFILHYDSGLDDDYEQEAKQAAWQQVQPTIEKEDYSLHQANVDYAVDKVAKIYNTRNADQLHQANITSLLGNSILFANFATSRNSILVDLYYVRHQERQIYRQDTVYLTLKNVDTGKVARYYYEPERYNRWYNTFRWPGTDEKRYSDGTNFIRRVRV